MSLINSQSSENLRSKDDSVKNLTEAYKKGAVPQVTAGFYNNWAKNDDYEQDLNGEFYRGPEIAAKTVAEYFPESQQRQDARILDVAAGTGFVAEHLKQFGFRYVDALDPSEGMLAKARLKNVYDHFICAYVDENKLPMLPDTYDCVVSSGGMGEGHIPFIGLGQLARVVKPGGLIILVMREEYLQHSQYAGQLEPYMESMCQQGQWELVARIVEPEYCFHHNGLIYVYRILPTKASQAS